jgi:hypothetical protein
MVMPKEQKEDGQEWIVSTGEATGIIPVGEGMEPIQVIANQAIRQSFGVQCLQQAVNSRLAPGVTKVVLNPDAHLGYGAPVGCVMVAPDHIYPGPVGVDIKCLSALILAGGGKSYVKALQRIGRVIRSYPGKKFAAIVDFYDDIKYLKAHSINRCKIYMTENGFKVIPAPGMKV